MDVECYDGKGASARGHWLGMCLVPVVSPPLVPSLGSGLNIPNRTSQTVPFHTHTSLADIPSSRRHDKSLGRLIMTAGRRITLEKVSCSLNEDAVCDER